MMPIRSARMSASSIEWVVRMMTRSFFILWMRSHTCLRDMGSIPVVGSSMKMISGSPMLLMATESRRFIPPEKLPTRLLPTSRSLTLSSFSSISCLRMWRGIFLSLTKMSRCSRAVNSFQRTSCWGHTPIDLRIAVISVKILLLNTNASPDVGPNSPVMMLIEVVFPAPLWPRRQKRVPGSMLRLRLSRARLSPALVQKTLLR
mmetsp:Transcript_31185/g.52560  ORF Transcript_31185/g.52560 Transcript_31185/m.52560 type:complete len:203 (+) Transcript_31185:316-924(+)